MRIDPLSPSESRPSPLLTRPTAARLTADRTISPIPVGLFAILVTVFLGACSTTQHGLHEHMDHDGHEAEHGMHEMGGETHVGHEMDKDDHAGHDDHASHDDHDMHHDDDADHEAHAKDHHPETSSAEGELETLFWARQDSAKMNFTQAEVTFMTDMIIHHSQALVMSDLAPRNGAGPAVSRLASRIINAQKDEVATMQRWLRERGQPVPVISIDGIIMTVDFEQPSKADHAGHGMATAEHTGHEMTAAEHSGHAMDGASHADHSKEGSASHAGHEMAASAHAGHTDHSDMVGMLSQAQLEELRDAKRQEFDRLFLTYMIQHHSGAIVMVEELFKDPGAGQEPSTFRLASDIQADQTTEIAMMQKMLDEKKY